jgi:hypothetical protein
MRPKRFGRQWRWPRRWWLLFVALGWDGCPHYSRHFTWRDA